MSSAAEGAFRLWGYADALSARAGETVRFMVSSELPEYEAQLVRLIHGDTNPQGPGHKEEEVEAGVNGTYKGQFQPLRTGSHGVVPDHGALRLRESFTLQAWIYPTTPGKGVQGIVSKWEGKSGYALVIEEDGSLGVWVGDGETVVKVRTGKVFPVYLRAEKNASLGDPLHSSHWYFAVATFDASSGEVKLYQEPLVSWPGHPAKGVVSERSGLRAVGANAQPLMIAGMREDGDELLVDRHFNGKIGQPRIYDRVLTLEEIGALKAGEAPEGAVAAWDFSQGISTAELADLSANALHGETVNRPTRGVTGHNWSGREADFKRAPGEYGAIHFHDDDLDDAGWRSDFSYTVPEELKSGVYAMRLRAEEAEYYVPFFATPAAPAAEIAFLAPTFSYLAYANIASGIPGLLSLYDKHSDGSGVSYSSHLRPIVNMRPKISGQWGEMTFPHQFNADLHIVDWLEAKGHAYDVITDGDLHREGAALLASYKVVVTGSHPEYHSEQMLDGIQEYLQQGGRLMYMGGNGFYWVTGLDPDGGHAIEIRRWGGTQTWEAQAGEYYLSTTGEMGGLWRARGRVPQQLVGVGFSAQGPGRGVGYARQEGSFDPRAAFIFEGIGAEEVIGDFPSLVMEHGAATMEVDRFDFHLGTPPHALLLATASGLPDEYFHVIEEVNQSNLEPMESLIRADMVYFEYPRGGAVFSASAIGWGGCLSYNNYDNNVSRITDNVLRRFSSDIPLPAVD